MFNLNYYIYELLDPRTGEIKYVGKTKNITKRFKQHLSPSSLKPNTPKNTWIKSLLKENLIPKIRTLCLTTDKYIDESEILKIKEYRELGIKLTNCTDGGDGLRNPNMLTRIKISNSKKGKPAGKRTKETCEKISLSQKGKPKSPWLKERKIKQSTPVIAININTHEILEFIGAQAAAKTLGLNQSHITSCCKNRYGFKTHGGYKWKYKE